MSEAPEISVVLPTHDRPVFLADAIASVRAQTVTSWELVVVDNGSSTPFVVPSDDRIEVIRLPENLGPARARNVGATRAQGAAIAFLDDDDQYTPERLAIALKGLLSAPIAVCASRFLDAGPGRTRLLLGDVADEILDDLTPSLGATAVRRESFLPFDERWMAVEDIDWWWRTAQRHFVETTTDVGYLVRRHDGPRSRNDLAARLEENLAFVDEHRAWFARHRRAKAFRLRRAAALAEAGGDRVRSARLLAWSLCTRPTLRAAAQARSLLHGPQRTAQAVAP
jgi:glycosyltransferase involved in cell wall biosynthesis